MIIIEPPSVYADRLARSQPTTTTVNATANATASAGPVPGSDESYWTGILFETLKLEGGLPVKIVSLVSAVAKWGDYGCRADRERRKLELLRLVGRLIQTGELRRIARNYVALGAHDQSGQQQ